MTEAGKNTGFKLRDYLIHSTLFSLYIGVYIVLLIGSTPQGFFGDFWGWLGFLGVTILISFVGLWLFFPPHCPTCHAAIRTWHTHVCSKSGEPSNAGSRTPETGNR
jgi:hypothetical protein